MTEKMIHHPASVARSPIDGDIRTFSETEQSSGSRVIADALRSGEVPSGTIIIGVTQRVAGKRTSATSYLIPKGSEYAMYIFMPGIADPLRSSRLAVAMEDPSDRTLRDKAYRVDEDLAMVGEFSEETATSCFSRQIIAIQELAKKMSEIDSHYEREKINNAVLSNLISSAISVHTEHPELDGYFDARVDLDGQPSEFILHPIIDENENEHLYNPRQPLISMVSDEEIRINTGILSTLNTPKLDQLKPPDGWKLSHEALARFGELAPVDKLRFIHERRENPAFDLRSLTEDVMQEVIGLDFDDPARVGLSIKGQNREGIATAESELEWHDMHVVFPDQSGTPVSLQTTRGEVIDERAWCRRAG